MNRLAGETSPYLIQHAHNPVDWYPWGPEALQRAADNDRPVFLSIGYAACHWCHVMERESFEDASTAAQLNADFVAIKVDREERPDLDAIYMSAVQALTGQGGWPMSVFLTPDGRPFYGGTYFPAARGLSLPTFRDVLDAVSSAWRDRRAEVEDVASRLAARIARASAVDLPNTEPVAGLDFVAETAGAVPLGDLAAQPRLMQRAGVEAGQRATAALIASFDRKDGGWGDAPKFPQPAVIEFLLARTATNHDREALAVAERALHAMAAGGIHDQVGGGFHRYSTDAHWLVPHFEKMLYDNAQLARAYLHAYQLTGDAQYARVAERTLQYLRREMVTEDGLFAASQDADTDGVEGATYAWTLPEIAEALGPEARLVADACGITDRGNWEGRNVLSRALDDATLAAHYRVTAEEAGGRLETAMARLLKVREDRPQPARDDKALAAWNGLAISAFAEAARVLDRSEFLGTAARASDAALRLFQGPDGRLRRSWRDGRATPAGYLEDYALLSDGLLAMYGATFDERWFAAARGLMDDALARFADPSVGFWDTADDHEKLIARPRRVEDNAVPSGGAVAAAVLLRLAALTGEERYRSAAEAALPPVTPLAARYPTGFAAWLQAIDLASAPLAEVAIVGDPQDPATQALVRVATGGLHPHRVVAVTSDSANSRVELLQSRFTLRGRPTAFVCRDFACRQPVTEPEALAAQLVG